MLKAIHAQEDATSAQEKATAVVEKLKALKLKKAAEKVAESVAEMLTYYRFPSEHHRQIRTNNMLERIMREICRRTRVVGAFPDGRSALMLAAARLRYVSGSRWGTRRYLDMDRLKEMEEPESPGADKKSPGPWVRQRCPSQEDTHKSERSLTLPRVYQGQECDSHHRVWRAAARETSRASTSGPAATSCPQWAGTRRRSANTSRGRETRIAGWTR